MRVLFKGYYVPQCNVPQSKEQLFTTAKHLDKFQQMVKEKKLLKELILTKIKYEIFKNI